MLSTDIIVVGAGIAGASAAAEMAAEAAVVMVDMESQPGYHATGRSAAYFATSYGKRIVQEITASCESFLLDPPAGFTEVDLLLPRDNMFFARGDQAESLAALAAKNPHLEAVDETTIRERVPVFRPGYLHGGLWDRKGGDLDVDALLQAFVRQFRIRGGQLYSRHRVTRIDRVGGQWIVTAGERQFSAPVLVNAAGGWVEEIAGLAGLGSLGIKPFRRTALTIEAPAGVDISGWPEMVDVDEDFYFKPDAGLIMISPADETATRPADVQAEEIDVAMGVHRFEQATGLDIRQVRARWAGMRTFAPDRLFVAGFDPRAEGFFWLAGQGGVGVQSSPAMARLASYLVTGAEPEGDFAAVKQYIDELAPDRLLYDLSGH
ncbi:MAG: FAD-binding oxidoreductase [Xanthomonadales bacterium]|jgi:D-arginine dehydrogenase|nr:FAD-binding oxidoreductase [Xanthomonadales bacterium]